MPKATRKTNNTTAKPIDIPSPIIERVTHHVPYRRSVGLRIKKKSQLRRHDVYMNKVLKKIKKKQLKGVKTVIDIR